MAGSTLKESKRDSKGDMPVGLTPSMTLFSTAKTRTMEEACSRQRLLCSGASISDSAEVDLTRNTSHTDDQARAGIVGDHGCGYNV